MQLLLITYIEVYQIFILRVFFSLHAVCCHLGSLALTFDLGVLDLPDTTCPLLLTSHRTSVLSRKMAAFMLMLGPDFRVSHICKPLMKVSEVVQQCTAILQSQILTGHVFHKDQCRILLSPISNT